MRPPHRAAAAINPERAAMTRFVLLIAGLVLCAGTALAQQPGMPPPVCRLLVCRLLVCRLLVCRPVCPLARRPVCIPAWGRRRPIGTTTGPGGTPTATTTAIATAAAIIGSATGTGIAPAIIADKK